MSSLLRYLVTVVRLRYKYRVNNGIGHAYPNAKSNARLRPHVITLRGRLTSVILKNVLLVNSDVGGVLVVDMTALSHVTLNLNTDLKRLVIHVPYVISGVHETDHTFTEPNHTNSLPFVHSIHCTIHVHG